ncbi:hypothetical protein D3C76_942240 [compost metagenome]
MAMPEAPCASAATRPLPSRKPPAATTGTSTAATTWASSIEVGTEPVCPPPSPPWMVTTSAPISTAFCACFRAPTVGMQITPASFSREIIFGPGERL